MTSGKGENPYQHHVWRRLPSYPRSRGSTMLLLSTRGRFNTPRGMLIRWQWSMLRSCQPRAR